MKRTMPLFSIIVVHYQGTVSPEVVARGIASLQTQTFTDYEILCYHDGPLLDPHAPQPLPLRPTERRFNDSGHSLRDIGLREASGDYIVHFNADNVLYPFALETIANEIRRPSRLFDKATGRALDTDNIIIFPIVMKDIQQFGHLRVDLPRGSGCGMIFTGNPPRVGYIDCMQLVMKRHLWLAEGGWTDKRVCGDGVMYEHFAKKYGYRAADVVLGEHH
jgi:hypothetical protein